MASKKILADISEINREWAHALGMDDHPEHSIMSGKWCKRHLCYYHTKCELCRR